MLVGALLSGMVERTKARCVHLSRVGGGRRRKALGTGDSYPTYSPVATAVRLFKSRGRRLEPATTTKLTLYSYFLLYLLPTALQTVPTYLHCLQQPQRSSLGFVEGAWTRRLRLKPILYHLPPNCPAQLLRRRGRRCDEATTTKPTTYSLLPATYCLLLCYLLTYLHCSKQPQRNSFGVAEGAWTRRLRLKPTPHYLLPKRLAQLLKRHGRRMDQATTYFLLLATYYLLPTALPLTHLLALSKAVAAQRISCRGRCLEQASTTQAYSLPLYYLQLNSLTCVVCSIGSAAY